MRDINVFKSKRLLVGFTVKEASELLGIAESTLFCIENGNRKPGKKTIKKMSMLYRTPIEELFNAS